LKITTEPLESRQLRLTIETDEEQTKKAMQRAARQISKQVDIAGFRKGKAPYELILQRFGEDTVRKEAAEALIEEVYEQALEQEKIGPYAPAKLDEIELHPIAFTFTIPLQPTVDLGDYRNYRLKYKKVKVSKKEVQEALEEIRLENAMLELVERPLAIGDGAVIDLVATVDGEKILEKSELRIMAETEATHPAPGFAEAIVGMEAGDERTFTLALPDDSPREDLRGREAEFHVKMIEVYDQIIPALDDDLARTVGSFDSLKQLETRVKERLQLKAQMETDREYTDQAMSDIAEQAEIEYPPVMLERSLDGAVKEFEATVKRETMLSLADYLRMRNETMETLREELTPNTEAQLRRTLMLGEVVRLEGIEVSDEEVNARIAADSALWGVRAEEVRVSLSSDVGKAAVRNRLLGSKAMLRLVAIAKGEAPDEQGPEKKEAEEEE
jgi:trigger factor